MPQSEWQTRRTACNGVTEPEGTLPDDRDRTVAVQLRRARRKLSESVAHGCEATRSAIDDTLAQARSRDSRRLLSMATGVSEVALLTSPERVLSEAEIRNFDDALSRRAKGEPLTRILGTRGFSNLELLVTPEVLDPRPDTETLVDAVTHYVAKGLIERPRALLELGTGSGALTLSLLEHFPDAFAVATDISQGALLVARRNARRSGLVDRARFVLADWLAPFAGGDHKFDVVVSNPPYVPTEQIAQLDVSVRRFDPHLALDGGNDGLNAYRRIAERLTDVLSHKGIALFEIGLAQGDEVADIFTHAGLTVSGRMARVHRDLTGIERCILVRNTR